MIHVFSLYSSSLIVVGDPLDGSMFQMIHVVTMIRCLEEQGVTSMDSNQHC